MIHDTCGIEDAYKQAAEEHGWDNYTIYAKSPIR